MRRVELALGLSLAMGCSASGAGGETEGGTTGSTTDVGASVGSPADTEDASTGTGANDVATEGDSSSGSSAGGVSSSSTTGAGACGEGVEVYEDDSMAVCPPPRSTTERVVECLCNYDPALLEPAGRPLDATDPLYYVNRWYSIDPCFPFTPDASVLADVRASYINAVDDLEPELERRCGDYEVEFIEVPPAFTNDDDQLLSFAWISPVPADYLETLEGEPVGFNGQIGFGAMFIAAAQDGIDLFVQSGFRSLETQASLFEYYAGLEGDPALAAVYSAWPAHSEHQLGTTADVGYIVDGQMLSPFDPLEADLHATEAFAWIRAHAHRFGIVTTYEPRRVHVHQYKPEPWHLRFVGAEAADVMHTCGLSTEELLAYRYGIEPLPEFENMDLVYDAVFEGGWSPQTCQD